MGESDFGLPSQFGAENVSITVSAAGNTFISFIEPSQGNKAIVKKLVDGSWQVLGSNAVADGAVSFLSLAVDGSDNVYVAYKDLDNGGKATVKKWAGSAWEMVGTGAVSTGVADYTTLALSASGVPYLFYSDGDVEGKATVRIWSGSDWEDVGVPGFSNGAVSSLSMAFDATGTLHVSYSDASLLGHVYVKKKVDAGWVDAGNAISENPVLYSSIYIHGNELLIAYSDTGNSDKATVKTLVDNVWETVGSAGFSPKSISLVMVRSDDEGVPYVFYKDSSLDPGMMKFNGEQWEEIDLPNRIGSNGDLGVDFSEEEPIVIYPDQLRNSRAVVLKYHRDEWQFIGPSAASGGVAAEIGSDKAGNLFVASSLEKLLSSTWANVANSGMTGGLPYNILPEPKSVFDDEGNVYVSFKESFLSKGKVAKWDGSTWNILGDTYFSSTNISQSTLGMYNNEVYVAFPDGSHSSRATVKKWTGSQWVDIGTAGFSTAGVSRLSIHFDEAGSIYLGFLESSRIRVMKFASGNWSYLGVADDITDFDALSLHNIRMALDNAGNPYVAYLKDSEDKNTNIKRWNGDEWLIVDTEFLAEGTISNHDIIFDADGRLIISYVDQELSQRVYVKVLTETGWETVGTLPLSYGSASSTSLAMDNFGGLYCMFYTFRAYNYVYRFPIGEDNRTEQTILFGELGDKVYGDDHFEITATGGASGNPVIFASKTPETVEVNGNTVIIRGAGEAIITTSQDGNDSYKPAPSADRSFTIGKATLTAKPADHAKYYGQENPGFFIEYTGLVYEDFIDLFVQPVASTTAVVESPAGTYPITLSGGKSDNYDFVFEEGVFTVLKTFLYVQADNVPIIYGDPVHLNITYRGFENGDTVEDIILPSATTTANSESPVGVYPISFSGGEADNYEFIFYPGFVEIIKAELIVKAVDAVRVYKRPNPVIKLSLTGLKNDDTVNSLLSIPLITIYADINSDAGEYRLVPHSGHSENYTFTYEEGILTILKDTATIILSDLVQVFDEEPKAVTVATIPEGLDYEVFYNEKVDLPIAGGRYTAKVNILDKNYYGTNSAEFIIRDVTGVFDSASEIKASVYPNPATDKIFISVSDNLRQEVEVRLYDAKGRVVIEQSLGVFRDAEIATRGIGKGVFLLVLVDKREELLGAMRVVLE